METPVEAWRISVPTLKDNFKDVLQRKKFKPKPARRQKMDSPQGKMDEIQSKPQKLEEKIDTPKEKDAKSQEKIDKPLEEKENPLTNIDEAQKRSVEPQENKENPIRKTKKGCESKTFGSDQPGLKLRKPPRVINPSISSISQSANSNCRNCCLALGELFKEVYKRINGDPNSRVGVILNKISNILLALVNDCVLCLKIIGTTATSSICKVVCPMQGYVTTRVKTTQKYASDKVSAAKDTSLHYAKKVSDGITATIDKSKQCAVNACNGVTATIDKTKQYAADASNCVTAAIDKSKQHAGKAASLSATGDKSKHLHAAKPKDELKKNQTKTKKLMSKVHLTKK